MSDPLKTIESLQNIQLSENEKSQMFSHIQAHIDDSIKKPVISPFNIFSFAHHHAIYASSFAVIMLLMAGTTAADTALPGDLLYPVKRKVNENIIQAFAFGDTSKAEVQIKLVERRFEEAEKVLASTPEDEEVLTALATDIQEHATVALDHIATIQNENSVIEAIELSNELSTAITAHDLYIDTVTEVTTEEAPAATMRADNTFVETTIAPIENTMAMKVAQEPETDTLSIPTLQSIIEETKAQVEMTTGNLTSIVYSSEAPLITKDKVQENKTKIEDVLENPDVSTTTKAEVQALVTIAEENLSNNNPNGAFIILEEAEKLVDSNLKKEEIIDELGTQQVNANTDSNGATSTPVVE